MGNEKKVESNQARTGSLDIHQGNPAVWMDWMRFRQENYAEFFTWQANVIRKADPDALDGFRA